MRTKVTDALTAMTSPEHKTLMRGFISGIFVGFKKTDAKQHLEAFRSYLELTGLAFNERIAR
jgi:hypothetical protein